MDRVNHNITRRDFLKFMGLGALATTGLVGGNNPSKQNVEAVPTPNPNVLTSPRPYDEEVTIDYQIAHQRVYTAIDKNGYQIVTGYENPVIDQYQGGFDQNEAQYRWGDEPLPRVEVGNTEYPLLTSLNLKDEELQTISSWYKNSHLIKELLKKLPESGETAPIKVDTLVVNFRSISDDYYMPNSGSSDIGRFVNERDPDYEPLDLFKKTADAIREVSDGFVDYRIKVEETIDEYDMSRTNDPRCAPQELININKYVVNYYEIGKLAIKHETDTVFIYTGPNGGMYESYTWTDPDTKKQILIFGLNYNRDWTQNLHSWMHFLEDRIKKSDMKDIYLLWSGRDEEYETLPYSVGEHDMENYQRMIGEVFAAIGYGNVHLPPNALAHYADYNNGIKVLLPGLDKPIDCEQWDCDEVGYYKWWLKHMPREFFSAVGNREEVKISSDT